MKVKYFILYIVLLTAVFFCISGNVKAITTQELQAQIQVLMAQIAALQAQLNQMQGGGTTWCHTFTQSLKIKDSGSEVVALQTALTKDGSARWEYKGYDGEFDEVTSSEVVAFQEKYASEILAPNGLKHGTGFVGGSTKKKLNALYACNVPDGQYAPQTSNSVLEAFVVSRCPYGLQMQRIMADVVQNIPDMAKYLRVRYIGSISQNRLSSMHGDAEAVENLRQICIREEQPTSYWPYVSCQMKATGTEKSCEQSVGVDSAKLSACVSDPQRGITFAQQDVTLDNKYNISGSPTLILNGQSVSEFDFGGRNSEAIKSIICSAFSAKISFCSQTLNKIQAATSFSPTYSVSSESSPFASGSCGNIGTQPSITVTSPNGGEILT